LPLEGTIVVADTHSHRLRKIRGRQVTTLAGVEAGAADGTGAGARFKQPWAMALDERGRLLVAEFKWANTLRVVEAGLAPPVWMGAAGAAAAAAQAQKEKVEQMEPVLQDYGDSARRRPVGRGDTGGWGALSAAPRRADGAERERTFGIRLVWVVVFLGFFAPPQTSVRRAARAPARGGGAPGASSPGNSWPRGNPEGSGEGQTRKRVC